MLYVMRLGNTESFVKKYIEYPSGQRDIIYTKDFTQVKRFASRQEAQALVDKIHADNAHFGKIALYVYEVV